MPGLHGRTGAAFVAAVALLEGEEEKEEACMERAWVAWRKKNGSSRLTGDHPEKRLDTARTRQSTDPHGKPHR